MPLIAQFVDRISTAATVRLDLNAGPWRVFAKDTSTPPPRLNRASSSTTLADGEVINAASYGNRVINLSLKLSGTLDNDAAEVQKLVRELSRPFNFLRWQVGSQPQWFITLRSEFDPARWDTVARRVTVTILAAPYAYGEEQTAGPFPVDHDPAGAGGCFFDLTGVKGDVETPLVLKNSQHMGPVQGDGTPYPATALWAVRRRGTPSAAPFLVQAEAMDINPGSDCTLITDVTFSPKSGNTGVRCTFATNAGDYLRLIAPQVPAVASKDARGRYRVLARMRKQNAGDVIWARLVWSGVQNAPVQLPPASNATRMVDLGDVSIPVGMDPVSIGYGGAETTAKGIIASLYMSRTSGSGYAEVDYLLFIPADDCLSLVTYRVLPTGGQQVFDGPREMAYGIGLNGEVDGGVSKPSTLPGGSGYIMASPGVTNRIYLVRDVDTIPEHPNSHSISVSITNITVSYWPRYLLVRPVAS